MAFLGTGLFNNVDGLELAALKGPRSTAGTLLDRQQQTNAQAPARLAANEAVESLNLAAQQADS